MAAVTVITPCTPGRERLANEAAESVMAQTIPTIQYWEIDDEREGCSVIVNRLAAQVHTDYLLILADDDLLLPGCIEALLEHATDRNIVYPKPLVWGEPDSNYTMSPPDIPSLALIPTAVWRELGGYDETINAREDHDFWVRCLHARIPFVRHDTSPTWVYRFHGGNKSRNDGVAH